MEKRKIIRKKICMLGTFGVGKTSLVRRFVYDRFEEKYLSTIGVMIHQKQMAALMPAATGDPVDLELIVWDIAHIEKFDPVIRNYFRGAHGAIVVLDATRPATFEEIDKYLKPFLEINPKSKLIVALNKSDLNDENGISVEQLLPVTKTYKISVISTSAKTGANVEQLFVELSGLILTAE